MCYKFLVFTFLTFLCVVNESSCQLNDDDYFEDLFLMRKFRGGRFMAPTPLPCNTAVCSPPCPRAAAPRFCPRNLTHCGSGCACIRYCEDDTEQCFMVSHCIEKRRFLNVMRHRTTTTTEKRKIKSTNAITKEVFDKIWRVGDQIDQGNSPNFLRYAEDSSGLEQSSLLGSTEG